MKTIRIETVDGIGLAADIAGDPAAPCVVLMHGGGQTRASWSRAGEELVAAGYRIVNFDARGHGESDWAGPGGYDLGRSAADLACVIEGIEGSYALVGASLGGVTALRAMAEGMQPDAVVLVDIVPNPHPAGVARIRAFMQARPEGYDTLDEVADAIAAYNPHRPRPRDTGGLMRNLRLNKAGRYVWHWDPAFLGREIDDELTELTATIEGARRAHDVPTLLIRGTSSDVVSDEGIAILRDVLSALEVHDVAGAGHMVAGDRNDAFNAGLIAFLRRHFPALRAPDQNSP
ncbi:alpha/beta hydrolase [Novosphingobium sp. BL-8H]|uniref:alpha/beta fold hydrolase n=1 Tax=Novosphingobium sp. BL-8H TaxID=3127640 RepID=UPI003757F26B